MLRGPHVSLSRQDERAGGERVARFHELGVAHAREDLNVEDLLDEPVEAQEAEPRRPSRGRRSTHRSAAPAQVAGEIADSAASLADRFETVDGDAWQRTGNRSDGARFTVETFARHFIHDPIHHLDDVAEGFAALGF